MQAEQGASPAPKTGRGSLGPRRVRSPEAGASEAGRPRSRCCPARDVHGRPTGREPGPALIHREGRGTNPVTGMLARWFGVGKSR